MDPVESWIDADSVRRMARQLLKPGNERELRQPEDAGFGPRFEGFLDSPAARTPSAEPPPLPDQAPPDRTPQPHVEDRPPEKTPPPVPSTAPPAPSAGDAKPFLSAEAPTPPPPPGSDTRGPLVARMERYRDWLSEKVGARGMFILDRDGDPVVDDPNYAKLHFLARSLSQAYRPVEGEAGNVHVKVGSDAYLAVVPVETDFGCLVLGAVLPNPLSAEAVKVVVRALAEAARPERRV